MKKGKLIKGVITGVIIGLLLVILTACGGNKPQTATPDNKSDSNSPAKLTFATQSVGTAMYMYASTIAGVIKPDLPAGSIIDVTTTSPGGVGAPIIIQKGDADLTMGNAAPAKWAVTDGILGSPPTAKVRSLTGGMGKDFVNILFTQEFVNRTGIRTTEELVAKKHPVRIVIKTNGSFGEMACRKVLEALGADYNQVKAWGGSVTQTGSDAIVSMLKDSKADITIDHIGAGQAATTELCMTTAMYFPELSAETRSKLNALGFDNVLIPVGTWKGQDKALNSIGSQQVLLCSSDMPEHIAYTITKSINENKQKLVSANATMDNFDPATAWEPLKTGAPLHPGAVRYYKEKGYMK